MSDSIEEQIAKILASAPSVEDYLAPLRQQIVKLELDHAAAKTNKRRRTISNQLTRSGFKSH